MEKIINGKTYNTETSTQLHLRSDPRLCTANLYQFDGLYLSQHGQYYIASCGNPISANGITLVTPNAAKGYLEYHGTAEEFEAAFATTEG